MGREYEVISNSQFRNLNIFLVRMQSRTPHMHSELELGVVLDGSINLQTGTDIYTLSEGDLYLVNSLDAHEFHAKGTSALILSVQMSTRLIKSFLGEQPNIRFKGSARIQDHFVGKEDRYALMRLLCVELAYTYLGCQQDHEYKCFSLAAQLLHQIKRDIPNQILSKQHYLPLQQRNDRLLPVTNYIDENFTHKLLLEDIARREGVSMTYLSHLFKDTLGITFQGYLKQKRLDYAYHLINTTQRKILDISISSGFSDVRYLTKLFQERYGCTPKEYRKRKSVQAEKTVSQLESSEYLFTPQDGFLLLTPVRNEMREALQNVPLDAVW